MEKNYSKKLKILAWALPLLLLFCLPTTSIAQTTDTYNPGDTSWVVPAGVFSIEVKIWGAGGGGGGSSSNNNPGSGGGSGAYVTKVITVAPTDTVNFVVGSGGTAGSTAGGDGGTGGTTTLTVNAESLEASGGAGGGGDEGAAGAGGATATGGTTNTTGNAGDAFDTDGSNIGGDGGDAPGGGGVGGQGSNNGNGNVGTAPGGGGGGGERTGGSGNAGGAGGDGQIQITYTVVAAAFTISGNGTTIADADVTPDSADHTDFQTLNTRQFSLTNGTASAITVTSITVSGTVFSVTNFTPSTVVAATSVSDFNILFSPAAGCVNTTATTETVLLVITTGLPKHMPMTLRVPVIQRQGWYPD